MAFLKQRSCVSTRKPCSANYDKPKIESLFPIYKTSASNENLPRIVGDAGEETKSNSLNDVCCKWVLSDVLSKGELLPHEVILRGYY